MHILRITLAVLGLWVLCVPLVSPADTGVYAFVDDKGELHLSNVPDNDRYRSLDAPAAPAGGGARDASELRGVGDGGVGRRYGVVVAQAAGEYGIDAALLHAVISVESGYNARAVSKSGAAGLMQLMPATARRYGVADVFDPAQNVRAGAQYLTHLLDLFDNDLSLALAAYNAGETAVIKYGRRIPPYRETAAYVPKVVGYYEKFRSSM
ncbi:MAG: lytic transglycosylase domain-containing protein [Burkholderiales bacterium]|nr:lytic transglycosylase domain-containing protein [Burkholderiales bacterium]